MGIIFCKYMLNSNQKGCKFSSLLVFKKLASFNTQTQEVEHYQQTHYNLRVFECIQHYNKTLIIKYQQLCL